MIDFVGLRRYFATFSLLLLIPCLAALAVWQLNPGIDFDGGLELEVRFLRDVQEDAVAAAAQDVGDVSVSTTDESTFLLSLPVDDTALSSGVDQQLVDALEAAIGPAEVVSAQALQDNTLLNVELWFPSDATQDDVRRAARSIDVADARIQETGDSSFKIRAEEPSDGRVDRLRTDLLAALEAEVGPFFVLSAAEVSGILSAEIAKDASIALIIASIAILIYISLAFRKLPNPAVYGAAAIVALMHDVTIVVGTFSILGQVAGTEVNAMFITALLAVIGYSVNDTIVIFDRIRENRLNNPTEEFRISVNAAITQSMGRSLNTSLTLVFALLALFLIGGVTVRPFVLVLLVGAVAGTYSSIGVASQIVVLWNEGSLHRFLGVGPRPARDRATRDRAARVSA